VDAPTAVAAPDPDADPTLPAAGVRPFQPVSPAGRYENALAPKFKVTESVLSVPKETTGYRLPDGRAVAVPANTPFL
jgi:hypothetical protein